MHDLEGSVFVAVFAKSCHHISKGFVASSFTTTSRSDKHNTKTYLESLEQVNDFFHEWWVWLLVLRTKFNFNLLKYHTVVGIDDFNSGEEILDDSCKEWKIVL